MSNLSLPSISSYGNYSSDNYGSHTLRVSVPGLTLFYSYKTIIAFRSDNTGLVVCENNWGPTTGKHLNWIDDGDKKTRLSRNEFQRKLQETMQAIFGSENV